MCLDVTQTACDCGQVGKQTGNELRTSGFFCIRLNTSLTVNVHMVLSFTEKLNNEEKWDIVSAKPGLKLKKLIFY